MISEKKYAHQLTNSGRPTDLAELVPVVMLMMAGILLKEAKQCVQVCVCVCVCYEED